MAEVVEKEIWKVLENVHDPEIPVLNVVEMGIVRNVEISDDQTLVTITPTYSGCPAMDVIGVQVKKALKEAGYPNPQVKSILHPPWTTDWMTDEARKKLLDYGIAPPAKGAGKESILGNDKHVACPHCGSENTEMISQFGSTACKSQFRCKDCLEPFEYFKCI